MVFKSIYPLQLKGLCKSDDMNKQQKRHWQAQKPMCNISRSSESKVPCGWWKQIEPQLTNISSSIWP